MDNRGRAFDNIFVERLWRSVKYEDLYLKGYTTMGELVIGLTAYFAFYNEGWPHQSLANQTPDAVYQTTSGGATIILEKYGTSLPEKSDPLRSSDIFGITMIDVKTIETTEEKRGRADRLQVN